MYVAIALGTFAVLVGSYFLLMWLYGDDVTNTDSLELHMLKELLNSALYDIDPVEFDRQLQMCLDNTPELTVTEVQYIRSLLPGMTPSGILELLESRLARAKYDATCRCGNSACVTPTDDDSADFWSNQTDPYVNGHIKPISKDDEPTPYVS